MNIDRIALEIAKEVSGTNYKAYSIEFARRLVAKLQEGQEPVAWVRYQVGNPPIFVPVQNGVTAFECSEIEALKYEPLYALPADTHEIEARVLEETAYMYEEKYGAPCLTANHLRRMAAEKRNGR